MTLPAQKDLILECLQLGELAVEGQFMWGSNYTFLCTLTYEDQAFKTVYKPVGGERPLWDFPSETLGSREVAAYLVSEAGGWHFVPPTVYREDGPAGPGPVQLYIEHDPEHHYFKFSAQERQQLKPIALFDAVINNTDRKGGHILVDEEGQFWLIDHGICFHAQPKLRTVIWDFAGQPIPDESCANISALRDLLEPGESLYDSLMPFLSRREIEAMKNRIDSLISTGIFPYPVDNRYSYPWPPV
jgi:uncharacterized repeat protein (TIGR03843 family)